MSVLDASVMIKWFVTEPDSDKADTLRHEYYLGLRQIVVPDLVLYEITNALICHPTYTTQDIQKAVATIFEMDLEIVTPTQSLLKSAILIARENKVTCYDAIYLALAKELAMPFITADVKFYEKLDPALKSNVTLLSQAS